MKIEPPQLTHPYAPFLYGHYKWHGSVSFSDIRFAKNQKNISGVLADHIHETGFENKSSFDTTFGHIRKALTLNNDAKGLKRCAAAVCHWNKHLEFRLDHFPPNNGMGYSAYYNMRDPLIQGLAFVQTILYQLNYSDALPVREPLFTVVDQLQGDQHEIVQEYMDKFAKCIRNNPRMGRAFVRKQVV